MNKKKILIVSRSFYPENSPRSFRTTELVKEFCRQGHDVTLYTIQNDAFHLPLAKEYGFTLKDLGKLKFGSIRVPKNRIGSLLARAWSRALLMFFEYPDIQLTFKIKKALKKESGYDLLISIAVPHMVHWGVAWSRSKKHPIAKTWVADCGDAYLSVSVHDSFDKLFYFKYLEKWFCRKADFISIPQLSTKEHYFPEFHHKLVEIPQGFKFEDVQVVKEQNNKVPTFAFAGVFMRITRNPTNLVEYLLKTGKDFKFIVFTRTPELLLPYRERLGEKLEIRDYIPRLELLKELSKCDFVINIGYDPSNHIPSKLIDYQLTGRPVLCFPGNDIDEKVVDEFLAGDYANAFYRDDIEMFRIENVCSKFLQRIQ